MKYKIINNNIDADFSYYLGREGLFFHFFGGKSLTKNEKNKVNYIWNSLLKQYIGGLNFYGQ